MLSLPQLLHDIQQCVSIKFYFLTSIILNLSQLKSLNQNQFKYVTIITAQAYLMTFFTYFLSLFDFYCICTDVNKKHVEEI